MRCSRGFTLLEVVISLAIAVLGIAAVAKATGGAATVAAETRERMLAVWVAGNTLTRLDLARAWPDPGELDTASTMGGRTWHLTRIVSETDIETIRRVDIEVYTDEKRQNREYRTFGYITRYTPPDATAAGGEESGGPESGEPGSEEEIPLPGEEGDVQSGESADGAGSGSG